MFFTAAFFGVRRLDAALVAADLSAASFKSRRHQVATSKSNRLCRPMCGRPGTFWKNPFESSSAREWAAHLQRGVLTSSNSNVAADGEFSGKLRAVKLG